MSCFSLEFFFPIIWLDYLTCIEVELKRKFLTNRTTLYGVAYHHRTDQLFVFVTGWLCTYACAFSVGNPFSSHSPTTFIPLITQISEYAKRKNENLSSWTNLLQLLRYLAVSLQKGYSDKLLIKVSLVKIAHK